MRFGTLPERCNLQSVFRDSVFVIIKSHLENNTWVRDKKSTKVFNDKVDEKIQIDMSLEENYKKFVDTYKS